METQGMKFEYREIPAELQAASDKARASMIEAAAEADEEMLNQYLEGGTLSNEQIRSGLKARARATRS